MKQLSPDETLIFRSLSLISALSLRRGLSWFATLHLTPYT